MKKIYQSFILLFITSLPAFAQVNANFTYSFVNNSQCVPAIIQFTNTSTGLAPLSYSWSFQDGSPSTSTITNPTVLFTTCGTKTVVLTTTNSAGATNVKTVTVFIACKPTASFTSSANAGCPPLTVAFTNTSVANSGFLQTYAWDFCDGLVTTGFNASHTFSNYGCYCTKLIVTNSWGCSDDTVINNNICVTQPPTAAITTLNPASSCAAPYTVNFSGLNSTGAVSYSWQFFGAGVSPATSTSPTPNVTYNNFGSFSVKLTVTAANGCSNSVTLSNYVNIAVNTANFTASALSICSGDSISFTGSSAQSYLWSVNPNTAVTANPSSLTSQHESFTFANSGTYSVCLNLTFNGGCVAQKCTTITVNSSPTASFTPIGTLSSCQAPQTISFTNQSTPGLNYQWSFPGGNPSSSSLFTPPNVIYNSCGHYSVKLIVINPAGCSDTLALTDTIKIDCPNAAFTVNIPPGNACAPFDVPFFSNQSSGNPNSWSWNFDYGVNQNNWVAGVQNPVHQYMMPGCHDVGLAIQNAQGCKDTIIIPQVVCLGIDMDPCFVASDTEVCAMEDVMFTDCTTPPAPYPPGVTVTYKYDFGDGGTSTVPEPTHHYNDTGHFDVKLITCYDGCCDTLIKLDYITVHPPIPDLQVVYDCDNPNQATLSAGQSIGADTYTWTIPGAVSTQYFSPDSVLVTWPMPNPNASYDCVVNVCNIASGCCQDKHLSIFLRNLHTHFKFIDSVGCKIFTSTIQNTTTGALSYNWTIFDATGAAVATSTQQYFSSASSPGLYTWSTPGIYTVRLISTALNGCKDTAFQTIVVNGLDPQFTPDVTSGCPPITVHFTNGTTNNSVSNAVSWAWNFGDTVNPNTVQSTQQNPTHVYTTIGTFTVSLIITDNHGCKDTLIQPSLISTSQPVANFIAPDTAGCMGDQICFFDLSTGNALTYSWDFGDPSSGANNTSTQASPCHVYASQGFKTVRLVVTDVGGCTDTLMRSAYINIGVLNGSFVADTTNTNCPPLLVSFTNTTAGTDSTSSFFWNFGDGVYSVFQNPQHIYSGVGNFTVTLIITNSYGCTDTVIYTNYIQLGGPTGVVTATPDMGCTPLNVCFNILSTNSVNPVDSFYWNLGDAAAFYDDSFVCHTYTSDGIFRAEVYLTDGAGCTYPYFIDSIYSVVDTAIFTMTPDEICAGNSVHFHDSSLAITPITLSWDFGLTGVISTLQDVDVIYPDTGTYIITLTSTASPGCSGIRKDTLHVTPPPDADFTYLASGLCQSANVQFTDNSNSISTIISRQWNFDDLGSGTQNFSTLINPTHNYNVPGTYVVKLILVAQNGCTDTTTKSITINPLPTANAGSDSSVCIGSSIQLSGSGAVSYSWSPTVSIDNSTSATPIASPTINTTYTLTVTDNLGCQGTSTVTIIVHPVPNPNAGSDANVCENDTLQLFGSGGISFSWSPSASLDNSTVNNPNAFPVITTTYTLTTTNAFGCTNSDNVVISVVAAPIASAGNDTLICVGTSGVLHASGNGNYQWTSIPAGFNSALQNPVINPSDTTVYVLKVTDANGCFDRDSVTVNVAQLPNADAGTDTDICFGTSTQLYGSGGSLYAWTPSTGLSATNISNPIASPVVTTTYSLTAGDGICFSSSDSVIVSVNALPVAVIQPVAPICPGSSTTLNVSGGINFSWTPASTLSDSTLSNPVANPLSSTTYTVTVMDANGCTDDENTALIVLPGPLADAGNDIAICIGSNIQLNGSGGVTYSWSPSGGLSASNISNPIASPVVSTTYVLTVGDATNCQDNDTMVVTVNSLPNVSAGADVNICVTGSAQLNATGGINYQWAPATDLNDPLISNPVASPTITTTYIVNVTDTNSCLNIDSMVVNVYSLPLAFAGNDTSVCNEDTLQLNATGGVSFNWIPNYNILNPNTSTPSVFPDSTTTYTVTVTDANNCTASDNVMVVWLPPPPADAGADVEVCIYDSVQLNASGGLNYLWSPPIGLDTLNINNPHSSPPVSTTYTVLVTDATGCTKTDDVFVKVNPLPSANAGPDMIMCSGTAIHLSGTGGITFVWNHGGTLNDSTVADPIALPDSALFYTVTVTDTNGCVNKDSMYVIILYPFTAQFSPDTCVCLNDAAVLHASANSNWNYYFHWSPEETLDTFDIASPHASPLVNTTYQSIVNDGYCYADTGYVEVCVYELPEVFAGYDQSIFTGQSVQLNAYTLDHGHFDWAPDSSLSCDDCLNPLANPVVTTTYIITMTDDHTCKDYDTLQVTVTCIDASMFVPNAFTPNGDGLNDKFQLMGRGIASLNYLRVFDRWGQVLFTTNSLNDGWDGTYNGKKLEPGIYIYYLSAICATGQTISRQGNITLIR